jgi:hypothetical protein
VAVQYDTVLNIVKDVAVECGLAEPSAVFASTDNNIVQLRRRLKSVGRGLVLEHDWLQCIKEHTLETTGDTSYALPADFAEMVNQTGWNRSANMPLDPMSPQQWQYLKASDTGVIFTVLFRLRDLTLELHSPSPGETIAFEYRSRYWVAETGLTTPTSDAPDEDDDVVCIDVQLITRALKLAFLRDKGFDTTAAEQDYQAALAAAQDTASGAAPILKLGGCEDPVPMLDERNAPSSGFGFDGMGGLY